MHLFHPAGTSDICDSFEISANSYHISLHQFAIDLFHFFGNDGIKGLRKGYQK